MKFLLLGHGISNDGVKEVLNYFGITFDYLEINEVNKQYDYIVKSPGIPLWNPVFAKTGGKVISDIELISLLFRKQFIAISGTNGKTTTTMLLNHLLEKRNVAVCGNIGYAIGKAVLENNDILLCELSSFQLEACRTFKPKIAVLTNLEPHHLDHHLELKKYINAKAEITKNQDKSDYLIYNFDSVYCKEIAKKSSANLLSFSTKTIFADCYIMDNCIYFHRKKIMKLSSGVHDYEVENLMSCLCVLSIFGYNLRKAVNRLRTFEKAPYRAQEIAKGVINDAKSTNPYSTIASLKQYENVLLICGGYDRGENINVIIPYLKNIKKAYIYGQSREIVEKLMKEFGVEYAMFQTLKEATKEALNEKKENIVLYSPMFASYDQYDNYIQRGKEFTSFVLHYYSNNRCLQ